MKIAEISVIYSTPNTEKQWVNSSTDSYLLFEEVWNKNTIELYEEVQVLLLNRANRVLGVYHVSKGGVSSTVVDAKLIFSVALKCNASGIILAHNHPSGSLIPSQSDSDLTEKLKKAGEFLGIRLLDHIIITRNAYYSFADNGLV